MNNNKEGIITVGIIPFSNDKWFDIEFIGRIAYLICRDGLGDLEQISLWNEYNVSFEIISSFSSSISYFKQQMKDFSHKYRGVAVLANCCSPIIENNKADIGFLATPAKQKQKPFFTEGIIKEYSVDSSCPGNCTYCKCAYIYRIEPMKICENNSHKGITINLEKTYLDKGKDMGKA